MRVIITKKEVFASKAGQEYVKLHYLSLDGAVGEIFTTKEKASAFKLEDKTICSPATLKEIEEVCDTVDVQFSNKGQVVSVSE